MPRITCGPETVVIGQVMRSYIDNLQAEVIRPLLEKYQLIDILPDQWYPLRPWLNVINELSTQPGFSESMIAVGVKVVEYAVVPEEMKGATLGQMLEGWDIHFHANHRGGEFGHITTERVNDKFYRTIHQHIYPDDLMYGLAYGFAKTLLPPGTSFEVWYEDCRHRLDVGGGDKTVINVQWE